MSNQLRRWWIGLTLTACMAVVPSALAAPGGAPAWTAPNLKPAVTAWLKSEIGFLKDTTSAQDAATLRAEILDPLKPKAAGGLPPADYRLAMADTANDVLPAIILDKNTPPYVALNAVIILVEINHINTDPALRDALKCTSAAVRYWAAKGLAPLIPILARNGLSNEVQSIFSDIAGTVLKPKGYLALENDPLVRGEMANVLAATANPKAFDALSGALATSATELKTFVITRAQLDSAATLMDAISKLVTLAAPPAPPAPAAIIKSAGEGLASASQRLAKSYASADPALLEGLLLQYNAYRALVNKLAKSPINLPTLNSIKGPADFAAIDSAIQTAAKSFAPAAFRPLITAVEWPSFLAFKRDPPSPCVTHLIIHFFFRFFSHAACPPPVYGVCFQPAVNIVAPSSTMKAECAPLTRP